MSQSEALLGRRVSHRGEPGVYTVSDAIENAGFGKYQLFMLLACALCWFVGAIAFESVTWLIEAFEDDESSTLGSSERGLIAMATPLGILLGSPFLGTLSDVWGRSKPIVVAMAITCTAFVIGAVATAWHSVFVLRVCAGFAVGGLEMIPNNLFIETTPINWRGKLRPLIHIAWHLGSVLCIIFASTVPKGDWKLFNVLCAVPIAFSFVVTTHWFLTNESPHFLNVAGKNEEAKKMLEQMCKTNGKEMIKGELEIVHAVSDDDITLSTRLGELMDPAFMLLNVVLSFIFMFLSASYYMSFVYFAEYLHYTDNAQDVHVIYTAAPAGRLLGSLVTSFVIDSVGRLKLIEVGGLFGGLFGILLVNVDGAPFLWLCFFFMYCALELIFCSLYTYAPELYPTTIRGMGLGILAGVGDSADVIFSFLGSLMSESHPAIPLYVSGGMLLAIMVLARVLDMNGLETAGHELSSTMGNLKEGRLTAREEEE
eukprot:c7680_g1_i1.p1 GENE.c7680_g1_i1~~c7680_g1_i1.p1  ORF type:complete len:483 (+),score=84.90 c7680_g1_i1:48-1496(+)